jgi:hypothetical protein
MTLLLCLGGSMIFLRASGESVVVARLPLVDGLHRLLTIKVKEISDKGVRLELDLSPDLRAFTGEVWEEAEGD